MSMNDYQIKEIWQWQQPEVQDWTRNTTESEGASTRVSLAADTH